MPSILFVTGRSCLPGECCVTVPRWPQLLPELVETDGLPDDLRETLAQRLLQRR